MITELDPAHVELVLETNHIGRIGCCDDAGRPYVVPVSYAYVDGKIVGHSNEGLKVRLMREHPLVCFQVDDIRDMGNWRSVIAWGRYRELEGQEGAEALNQLIERVGDVAGAPAHAHERLEAVAKGIRLNPRKGIIYQISLTEKTGRFEREPRTPRERTQSSLA